MTLAIAVSCVEGTVLVGDGMAKRLRPDGTAEAVYGSKVGQLPRAGLAFIRSGPTNGPLDDFEHRGFEADARRLFGQVQRARVEVPADALATCRTLDGGPISPNDALDVLNQHDLVVVATGPERNIALITDNREQWPGEYGVVVGGAAREWWDDQPKPAIPDSLPLCCMLALTIASRFRRYVYTDMDYAADRGLSETRLAPIDGSLRGLTITAGKLTSWTMQQGR